MVTLHRQSITNKELFYMQAEDALKEERYQYVRYNKKMKNLQYINSIEEVKEYLARQLKGQTNLTREINTQSSKAHRLLLKEGFTLHKRSKARRRKETHKSEDELYDYIKPGKFYLAYATQDNEPVYVNGQRVESDSEGELHRMLRYALDCKAQNLPNFLNENNILGHQFSIKRDVFKVPKGQHTHIIEKRSRSRK